MVPQVQKNTSCAVSVVGAIVPSADDVDGLLETRTQLPQKKGYRNPVRLMSDLISLPPPPTLTCHWACRVASHRHVLWSNVAVQVLHPVDVLHMPYNTNPMTLTCECGLPRRTDVASKTCAELLDPTSSSESVLLKPATEKRLSAIPPITPPLTLRSFTVAASLPPSQRGAANSGNTSRIYSCNQIKLADQTFQSLTWECNFLRLAWSLLRVRNRVEIANDRGAWPLAEGVMTIMMEYCMNLTPSWKHSSTPVTYALPLHSDLVYNEEKTALSRNPNISHVTNLEDQPSQRTGRIWCIGQQGRHYSMSHLKNKLSDTRK